MSAVMTETPAKRDRPPQLVFACKLKGCDAVVELKTLGATENGKHHRWTQLCAEVLVDKPRKKGAPPPRPPQARIAWAMADLSECNLTHWTYDDTLWIRSAAFDLDRADFARISEFLTGLGIHIEDRSK